MELDSLDAMKEDMLTMNKTKMKDVIERGVERHSARQLKMDTTVRDIRRQYHICSNRFPGSPRVARQAYG